jgi:hypothetical protein
VATYDLPSTFSNPIERTVLGHWGVDFREIVRSGFPISPYGLEVAPAYGGAGVGAVFAPLNYSAAYISGQQKLWTSTTPDGGKAPGGKALNPAAFSMVPINADGTFSYGNVPQNNFRGFPAFQTNLAIRRDFPIRDQLKLQFRAESFNLANHPQFGTINPQLTNNTQGGGPSTGTNAYFGWADLTLGNSLGGIAGNYATGGNRSMQFALKILF